MRIKEQKDVQKEKDFYIDERGFVVFTREFLLKRGFCCQNNCRHCPYKTTLFTATGLSEGNVHKQNSNSKNTTCYIKKNPT